MIRWQQWVLFAAGWVVSSFMTALLCGFSLDSPDLPKFMSKVAMGCAFVIPIVGLGLGIWILKTVSGSHPFGKAIAVLVGQPILVWAVMAGVALGTMLLRRMH